MRGHNHTAPEKLRAVQRTVPEMLSGKENSMSIIFYLQEKHYLSKLPEFFEKYKESPYKGPMYRDDKRANRQFEYWWPTYVDHETRERLNTVEWYCDQVVLAITVTIVATVVGKLIPVSLPVTIFATGICAIWGPLNYLCGWLSLSCFKEFPNHRESFQEYAYARVEKLQWEESRAWDRRHYCACAAPRECKDPECSCGGQEEWKPHAC